MAILRELTFVSDILGTPQADGRLVVSKKALCKINPMDPSNRFYKKGDYYASF